MRRHFVIAVMIVGVLAWSVSAVPLCEYRSPKTDISNLTLNFSYEYHNDPYGMEERDVSQGQFGVDYVRLFDIPEYGFDLSFTNDMTVSAQDVSTYTINADGNYKRYFVSNEDVFAYAGGRLRSSSSFQKLGLSFDLGVGTGRFTDVTPMAKATRIDDYLVNRGSLTDHLHAVDLQILAVEIGSASSYESISELLAVIQEVIENSGLVRLSGLDALDISEITRLIQEEGFSRYCGWDLKFGLGYELLDPSGGANDLLFSGAFNFALASTPKAQLLLQGSLSGPPDFLTTNRIDFTGSYDFFISEFLSIDATYDFSRETWAGQPTDTHQMTINLKLSPIETASVVASVYMEYRPYYLEWNTDIKLSIQMDLL
jgi:hypothetical protein